MIFILPVLQEQGGPGCHFLRLQGQGVQEVCQHNRENQPDRQLQGVARQEKQRVVARQTSRGLEVIQSIQL